MKRAHLKLWVLINKRIEKYLSHYFTYKEQPQKEQLLRQYLQHPLPRSLAHIPINLQILCCLSTEDEKLFTSEQPPTMAVIYDHLVNWLYKRFLKDRSKEAVESSSDSR